ncbi:TetR/AcrR family transcriptional regulator [Actinomadura darangshiensis]|uniref:TetR/AcrR family transcriptional regulator n=1 Tax=Actinomadura darangshiensis TaxID=705336 RepID=A0A4R5BAX2_9ACTN|nr:TetR/AcrR family transcriptional regulator [Actinomadura darangshiensis]TDD81850.1 TetR/AcrR family transcriptional regulator [Actinomadura darangshiensis]
MPLGLPDDPGPARLDRARIARAALDLLRTDGADAFSMRRLAAALQIKSPSLYWHVRSKDELFDLLVDDVLGTVPLPDGDDGPWDERLRDLGLALRRVLLAHPDVARLMPGRTPFGPNGLALAERVIGVLRRAGFDDRLAGYGYLLLMFYVVGFAAQETAFGKGPDNPERLTEISRFLGGLPADRYPNVVAAAGTLTGRPGLTDRFELGLTGILNGLDRDRASSR